MAGGGVVLIGTQLVPLLPDLFSREQQEGRTRMDRIFESIEEWMSNLLTGMVSSNLTTMYTDVNEKTGHIAGQVGQEHRRAGMAVYYSMIQNLSDSVIVPDCRDDYHICSVL